ncbi:MAG: class I SAM-dependent RNA methyltransferase [Bdellovibrionales bacterium]|nr:class I SAM-dependent RNA methyltransferase [Bdellovibrionales bacterium]
MPPKSRFIPAADRPTFEVQIRDLSRAGAGVGTGPDGRIVFVPLTAPGDRVEVRIFKEDKRYLWADLIRVIEKSPQRIQPKCAVFGRCGGCQWQHLDYETQWKTKASGVAHALSRVGVTAPGAPEELRATQIWGYRNRIQLRTQGAQIGFYGRASHDLVATDRCEIARDELNQLWPELQAEAAKRQGENKVEAEVFPDGRMVKTWNARHASQGFRQVHDAQNEVLKNWVGSAVTEGGVVLDLFGGSGNLSLGLVGKAKEIHCVDSGAPEPSAQDPAGFHFHPLSVLPWLKARKSFEDAKSISAILDPPRDGLSVHAHEILDRLEKLGVREIVAVGCDPNAWAHDLAKMTKRGWTIDRWAVLDLFPQTPHVESLARLVRRN